MQQFSVGHQALHFDSVGIDMLLWYDW